MNYYMNQYQLFCLNYFLDKKHVISNYYYFNLYIFFLKKSSEEEAGWVSKRLASGIKIVF